MFLVQTGIIKLNTMTSKCSKAILTTSIVLGSLATLYALYRWKNLDNKREKTNDEDLQDVLRLPLVDLQVFFDKEKNPDEYRRECLKVADAFHKYGVIVLKDPRVNPQDNEIFLNLLERYFESSDGVRDARPEYSYQVGVTPEKTGLHLIFIKTMF